MYKKIKDAFGTCVKYDSTLYADVLCLRISFLTTTYLTFDFFRYTGEDSIVINTYDEFRDMSITVNYEAAALLHQLAMSIIDDINSENEIRALIRHGNDNLIFEYKPDRNNQKFAYLTLEKNHQSVSFRFPTLPCKDERDGHIITEVTQSGLCSFAKTINEHLTGIGAYII